MNNRELYPQKMTIGQLYHHQLGRELRNLGYELDWNRDGTFEVRGYSREQLKEFSSRKQEIEQAVGSDASASAKAKACTTTRRNKVHQAESERKELKLRWQQRAEQLNIRHPQTNYQYKKPTVFQDQRELVNEANGRRVIEVGHKIVDFGYDSTLELEKLLNDCEQEIFSVTQQRIKSGTEHNSKIAMSAFELLESNSPIYPTGIKEIDSLMVRFEPGSLTILAARPSMGKSAISLYFALQQIVQHELPVTIFSLEMTNPQTEYRLWSLVSRLDCYQHLGLTPIYGDRIRQHRAGLSSLNEEEMDSIAKIVQVTVELPLYMNDNRGINVAGIASECRQVKAREGKLGLVIVDYLQMMASDSGGNRSYELGDVGRGLYQLAGELEVPILALSQVSRVGLFHSKDKVR